MVWFALLVLGVLPVGVESWPAFLGAGSQVKPEASLPLEWSPTENVAWQATLPGHGQSSPVIWGGRVFVTSVEGPNKDDYHTMCIDLATGRELWRKTIANSAPVPNSYYVSRAAPTPVVDGERLVVLFESGDCVAYTHDGEEMWRRNLIDDVGPLVAEFGLGASLCQNETHAFALLEHDGPSYLLALDKSTGKTDWKAERSERRSWSSPAMMRIAGVPQVVVSSAGTVDGYDPKNGELLWSFDEVGGNTGTTPIDSGNGRFLIGASPGRNGENAGSAADSNCLLEVMRDGDGWKVSREWVAQGAQPSWASPIVHQGLAYWINRAGVVYCFDEQTGEKVFTERIEQSSWATPIGVGDRVYFFGQQGVVTVLAAGREFKVLAENESWSEETLPRELELAGETTEERRRGAAMFGKPTLYGAAIANDTIVMRVGNCLIAVR
ncbi:outer membrane protein assembly factor BamB family protein [Aporhodopirellula aestuarii]|uniref:PQQ-binding-like beta-propeller repeat protein n=1 Tax=Aporhodopirellula aestuarii TaxID=2950107 RepID=A0ABT0U5K6_9BACT|nr:PQQ-binding-like beta-propeller repeat protein [Aporhodopirellula aestuarii]MCM2372150.1 PQQ-binding-like beta-propeller repeat protein [Aporhodopirellula aestuarii]